MDSCWFTFCDIMKYEVIRRIRIDVETQLHQCRIDLTVGGLPPPTPQWDEQMLAQLYSLEFLSISVALISLS